MSRPIVFISYSHDSAAHRESVLSLSERLRDDGIDTRLDQYVNGTPIERWPRWMLNQLKAAAFVLVVCTETYYRRFSGDEEPDIGKGVDWEGAVITNEIYRARSRTVKFVPVFLSDAVEDFIPEPLRGGTHYALTSEDAYQSLYDFLLQQSGVEPRAIGEIKARDRRKGTPLTFAETPPEALAKLAETRLTHAAEKLIGRETELQRLEKAWKDPKQHVLIVRGVGGEGKTSLVVEWVKRLAARDYDGASYFDWSFYSQGTRDQTAASSDAFLAAALSFFGGDDGKAFASSAASPRDKAVALLESLRQHRTLLVLDGLEPLQYPPGPLAGRLRDDAMSALLKGLAQRSPGLCVVTTREPVTDLAHLHDSTAPEWELDRLSDATGADLLKSLLEPPRPRGVHQVRSTPAERVEICRAVKGHALTLRLLGGFIHRALRDVRRWREVDYAQADAQYRTNPNHPDARYGHAFTTVAANEHWLASGGPGAARQLAVLRLLGLFDRPASGASLAALRAPPAIAHLTEPLCGIPDEEWNTTLSELEECKLIALPQGDAMPHSLDAHPLVREYFARQLREQQPEAWRAAHRRLCEHLYAITTDKKPNPTLEDLQPLYQAVAHGCQAGLQQVACDEVYIARILRREEKYSIHKLGAFGSDLGAVAWFFEKPWSRVSPALTEADQGWMHSAAAFILRALGRLTEALEPMRAGLENYIKQENWKFAAMTAGNLSELELTLGVLVATVLNGVEAAGAVGDAKQSVTYADRSGDAGQGMINRATHADALHQAGRRPEAEARFREAEQMQAERQPDYPLLYSLPGFRYCDLLLAEAERAAWQRSSRRKEAHSEDRSATGEGAREHQRLLTSAATIESCRAVSERAAQTIKIAEQNNLSLLTIALDHLTLGRAALYEAVLSTGSPSSFLLPASALAHIESAVDGLRRAGTLYMLPHALLTRDWQRFLTAPAGSGSAQSDLDEAWEIAERGPMPLFLADIHLHRARLFGKRIDSPISRPPLVPYAAASAESGKQKTEGTYPWESPEADLAEARRLILKHGYLRRMGELEDAEAALLPRP